MFNFMLYYWENSEYKFTSFNGPDSKKLKKFIFDHEDGNLLFECGWYNDSSCDQNEFDYDYLDIILNLMLYAESMNIA